MTEADRLAELQTDLEWLKSDHPERRVLIATVAAAIKAARARPSKKEAK